MLRIESRLRRIEEKIDHLDHKFHLEKGPVITADEAAKMLGMNVTKSKHHARRLSKLHREGFIKKLHGKRPLLFDRAEIEALAKKLFTEE